MKTFRLLVLNCVILVFAIFAPVFFKGLVSINGNLLVSHYPSFGQMLPYKATGWDQVRQHFPGLGFTQNEYQNFRFPLWNPYLFSGYPHLANFQSATIYPLTILVSPLHQMVAWHILRISPYLLAAIFAYLYLQNLRLNKIAAFFGSITFAFSSTMITWGEEVLMAPHVILWLPLALFAVEKFKTSKKIIYLALLCISMAFSLLAGHLQIAIYCFAFVALYTLFLAKDAFWKISLALLLALAISAIQLGPSIEIFLNSPRVDYGILNKNLIPPVYLLTYLAPDVFGNPATRNFYVNEFLGPYYEGSLFMGIAALIFALAKALERKKDTITKFFVVATLLSIVTSLKILPTVLLFLLPIPYLSGSFPTRILFIATFTISVLAALGLDSFLKSKLPIIKRVIAIIFLLYLLLIAYLLIVVFTSTAALEAYEFTHENTAIVALRNLAIPLAVFLTSSLLILTGLILPKSKKVAIIFVIIIAQLNVLVFAQKYLSFTEPETVFPKTPTIEFLKQNQGIWRTASFYPDYLVNNFALQYRLYWPEGYDPANIKDYADYVRQAVSPETQQPGINRSSVDIDPYGGIEPENARKRELINLLAIKYIVSDKEELLEQYEFKKVFEEKEFIVWENLKVLPRAFITKDLANPKPENNAEAEIISYDNQKVTIKTKSGSDAYLFLSDNYYPGWKAKIDGQETKIQKASTTLRAVKTPAGEHTITFFYDSLVFKISLLISLAAAATLIGLLLFSPKKIAGRKK